MAEARGIAIETALGAAAREQEGGRREAAEALYRLILAADPQNPKAGFGLATLLRSLGRAEEAALFFNAVMTSDDEELVLAAAGNLASAELARGHYVEAIAAAREALARKQDHREAAVVLGSALIGLKRWAEAAAVFQQVSSWPDAGLGVWINLGVCLEQLGRRDEAINSYHSALALDENFLQVYLNLSNCYRADGQHEEAARFAQKACQLAPQSAEAHFALGNARMGLGQIDDATAAFRRAVACQDDHAESWINLGAALERQRQYAEALQAYGKAVVLRPNMALPVLNQARVLIALRYWEQGIKEAERALAIEPKNAQAAFLMGNAQLNLRRLFEAKESYQKALALDPKLASAENNLGVVLEQLGEPDAAIEAYRRALAINPGFIEAHSSLLFSMNYHPDLSIEEIFAEYKRWDDHHSRRLAPSWPQHDNDRRPDRRLRVGYVSPDFCRNVPHFFFEPLIAGHNPEAVELIAYAQVAHPDEVTERLQGHFAKWHDTKGLSHQAVADRVRADGIDILVDLAGHTLGNRLPVFAQKPAPVQLSWLGFGYTTGLSAIDYYLADADFVPPGAEAYFSEKVYRLPRPGLVYRPPAGMPEVAPLPAAANGFVTFGYFSRPERVNHRVIKAWAALLRAIPGARLFLNHKAFVGPGMPERLRHRFGEHGVEGDRLIIEQHSPPWQSYGRVDIALDPFPHNAGTTTFEALWMGVPVLSLIGRPSVGRFGATILNAVGLSDWVAQDETEYQRLGETFARNLDGLKDLRAGLRARVAASSLCDEVDFVRSVEAAYREMWHRWCRS